MNHYCKFTPIKKTIVDLINGNLAIGKTWIERCRICERTKVIRFEYFNSPYTKQVTWFDCFGSDITYRYQPTKPESVKTDSSTENGNEKVT